MSEEERMIEMLSKTLKVVREHTEKELNKVAMAVNEALKTVDVPMQIKYMALQLFANSMREGFDEETRKACDDIMAKATMLTIILPEKNVTRREENNE